MKLSDNTVNLLKNFSTINTGIVIKPGKTIRTISANKAVFAEASVTEDFPKEFGVYDLAKVLSVLSLYTDPVVSFEDENLVLSNGRSKTRIRYTDTSLIKTPPAKSINVPFDVSFKLSVEDLQWINKIGAVLKSPHIMFENVGGKIVVAAVDAKGEITDDSVLELNEKASEPFKFVLKVENLKVVDGSYTVEISSKGVSKFTNDALKVTYFIAVESTLSHFGKKAE